MITRANLCPSLNLYQHVIPYHADTYQRVGREYTRALHPPSMSTTNFLAVC